MVKASNGIRRHAGFTLIEIMIAILILSVIMAIATPSFVMARQRSQAKTCVSQLRQVRYAKELWAMHSNVGIEDPAPGWGELHPDYLKKVPECPASGEYTIGAINEEPLCSAGSGHEID